MTTPTIESVLQEERLFAPPAEFSQQAYIRSLKEYQQLYSRAAANPIQKNSWSKQGTYPYKS